MKSACRIAYKYIGLTVLCGIYRIKNNCRRIGILLMAYYIDAGTFTPSFKLVNGCRTECIGCGKHNAFAFCLIISRKLAYCCCLSYSVYTDNENNRRRYNLKLFLCTFHKYFGNFVLEHTRYKCRILCVLFFYTLFKVFYYLKCCINTEVCHYKCLFKLIKKVIINLCKATENRFDSAEYIFLCLFKPEFKSCKKSKLMLFFRLFIFNFAVFLRIGLFCFFLFILSFFNCFFSFSFFDFLFVGFLRLFFLCCFFRCFLFNLFGFFLFKSLRIVHMLGNIIIYFVFNLCYVFNDLGNDLVGNRLVCFFLYLIGNLMHNLLNAFLCIGFLCLYIFLFISVFRSLKEIKKSHIVITSVIIILRYPLQPHQT